MKSPQQVALEAHLDRFLGRPRRVTSLKKGASSSSAITELTFAQFAPGGPRKPVVYATVGGFRHRMSDGRRLEALMVLKSDPRGVGVVAVRELLAAVVLTPEARGRALRHGDVLDAPRSLGPAGSQMTAVLLLPPMTFAKPFHRAQVGDDTVEYMWAVPVYGEEAAYAREHGTAALVALCAAQKVDLTNLKRRVADVSVSPETAQKMARAATKARLASMADGPARPVVKARPLAPKRAASPKPMLGVAPRSLGARRRA